MIIERIDFNNKKIKPQTLAHHIARYNFACKIQKPKGSALDLACGTGYGTEILRKAGYAVTGVEVHKKSIRDAKRKFTKCTFIEQDLNSFRPIQHYNLVVMFEAIEHLTFEDGISLLRNIRLWIKPGGIFLLSTPRDINDKYNRLHKSEWPYHLLKNELGSIFSDVRIYGQDWDTAKIDEENVRSNDFYIAVCKL